MRFFLGDAVKKWIFFIVAILMVCIPLAPWLFSLPSLLGEGFVDVGDTVGGTTAPFIGVLGALLLFYTLIEQIQFNKKQKELSSDEQFKSTFFNLLQVQRDIPSKISGEFSSCNILSVQQPIKQSDKIKIKTEKKEGLDFFKSARNQLALIFETLNQSQYQGEFYVRLEESGSSLLLNDSKNNNNDGYLIPNPKNIKYTFTNGEYRISKYGHSKYEVLTVDKKIELGYLYFFNRYDVVGFYFRHLYHILNFIKKYEDAKIESLGKGRKKSEELEIKNEFRSYAQFIQAQMSIDELVMTYYNSFAFPNARKLYQHYNFFENLTIENLILPDHAISEFKFKSKGNLFDQILENNC